MGGSEVGGSEVGGVVRWGECSEVGGVVRWGDVYVVWWGGV